MKLLGLLFSLLSAAASYGGDEPMPPTLEFMVTGPIGAWAPQSTNPVVAHRGLKWVLGEVGRPPGRDYTYSVTYFSEPKSITVAVEEAEIPRWILHEVELYFRKRAEQEQRRTPEEARHHPAYSYELRTIGGQRVFFGSNGEYVWTAPPNRVVQIRWLRQKALRDGSYELRELPAEFLSVYLERLPSSVPVIALNAENDHTWIREEFDRQFDIVETYLPRWAAGVGPHLPGADPPGTYVGSSLDEIQELRHKYFGGPSREERDAPFLKQADKIEKQSGADAAREFARRQLEYPVQKALYDELKTWWTAHRNDPIRPRE